MNFASTRSTSSSSAPGTPESRRPGRQPGSGARVAICTLSDGTVAHMPCNPGGRRNRQGASGPRDRCARRPHGTRHRRHGHPVQAAQPEPRPGGLVAPRASRQAALQRLGEAQRSRPIRTFTGLFGRAGRILTQRRPCQRSRARDRGALRLLGPRRHDGDVPQRPGSHRAASSGRPAAPASRRRVSSPSR